MKAETKLKQMARIYERNYKKNGRNITTHLYYNMAGAMIDLENNGGKADKTIMRTLRDAHRRIGRIGKYLPLELTK